MPQSAALPQLSPSERPASRRRHDRAWPPGALSNAPGDGKIILYECRAMVGSDVIPGNLLPAYDC